MATPIMRIAEEAGKSLPRKLHFTMPTLERITCPAGKPRAWVHDTRRPGLCLMVTRAGAKAFYFYKWQNGRPQRVRLGAFPELSVDQARDLAQKLTGKVAEGVDVAKVKREAREGMALGELWAWYLPDYLKARNKSWRIDEYKYEKHLADWKARRLDGISKADVVKLHNKMGAKHPTGANRVLALLRTMYAQAKGTLGYDGPDPTEGVEKFQERSRERFIQADELPSFFAALNDEQTPEEWRHFFTLLLLTGVRKGNLLAARWDDIALERAEWRIPEDKSKSGKAMTVTLSAEAVQILRTRRHNGSEWLFPSHGECGHLVETRKAWADILKRAGIKDLHPHDLRRSLGSWMAASGASLPMIGKHLGHQSAEVTQVYARLNLDPVRAAVKLATANMLDAAKPKAPAKPVAAGPGADPVAMARAILELARTQTLPKELLDQARATIAAAEKGEAI